MFLSSLRVRCRKEGKLYCRTAKVTKDDQLFFRTWIFPLKFDSWMKYLLIDRVFSFWLIFIKKSKSFIFLENQRVSVPYILNFEVYSLFSNCCWLYSNSKLRCYLKTIAQDYFSCSLPEEANDIDKPLSPLCSASIASDYCFREKVFFIHIAVGY